MSHHRLVIIGSGPSGYTAAIYAARANLQPVLFAGYESGGQLIWTSEVENFPGFPEGKRGPELMQLMRQQAERFGTTIHDEYVTAVDFTAKPFKLWTGFPEGFSYEIVKRGTAADRQALAAKLKESEPTFTADSVIISTGANSIMLGVPGEVELLGKGVSTCAVCDAAFYKDKNTFVVGGGDSAMEDTMALTKFAKSVTVIHRRDEFKASKIMRDRVLSHEKVKVLWNSRITEIVGKDHVTSIKVASTVDTAVAEQELPADGVFVAVGHTPITDLFKDQIELDDHGYVLTRQSYSERGVQMAQTALDDKKLVAFPTMTSVEGVFAAGDVVDVRYKQAITAAGQGCQAALDVERWLEGR